MRPEQELPRAKQATAVELHRARFEELSSAFRCGEFARLNEDGSTTAVVSYERFIDPLDRADLSLLSEFRHRAAASGLREAFSPLVLPTAATIDARQTEAVTFAGAPHRPLTFVQLGYERQPLAAPTAPASDAPRR